MHCKLVPLHPFERSRAQTARSLHVLSCEYSGNCIRFSIFAQQNIDSVFMIQVLAVRADADAPPCS